MGVCYEPLKKMLGRFVICVVQATAFLAIHAVPVWPQYHSFLLRKAFLDGAATKATACIAKLQPICQFAVPYVHAYILGSKEAPQPHLPEALGF